MSLDGAIWDLVHDHQAAGDEERRAGGELPPGTSDLRRDALVRLLDAAVGVLESTRHLIGVTEEVFKEQRDRLAAGPPSGMDRRSTPARDRSRQRIDLTF